MESFLPSAVSADHRVPSGAEKPSAEGLLGAFLSAEVVPQKSVRFDFVLFVAT